MDNLKKEHIMQNRKYQFTRNIQNYGSCTLYQIQALRAFGNVKAGNLGGFIEHEQNLSQEGNCWVADNAKVFLDARIMDNAVVQDNAIVGGDVRVGGNAKIYEHSQVSGYDRGRVWIDDNVEVFGHANLRATGSSISKELCISDNVKIFGNADILGGVDISENAKIYGNASILGTGEISGCAEIYGNAFIANHYGYFTIGQNAVISGGHVGDSACILGNAILRNGDVMESAHISGNAIIDGETMIHGTANVDNNAYLTREEDVFWVGLVGNRNYPISFYNTLKDGIWVNYVNEFDEDESQLCCSLADFLAFTKVHYAPKEYREFELLGEFVKSRMERRD